MSLADHLSARMPAIRAAAEGLPGHMRESICLWIERGEPHPRLLGSGLRAILTNNLMGCIERLDEDNLAALVAWGRFLFNYAPSMCYGSNDRLQSWYDEHHPTTAEPEKEQR